MNNALIFPRPQKFGNVSYWSIKALLSRLFGNEKYVKPYIENEDYNASTLVRIFTFFICAMFVTNQHFENDNDSDSGERFITMIYVSCFLDKVHWDVKRYESFLTHTFYM